MPILYWPEAVLAPFPIHQLDGLKKASVVRDLDVLKEIQTPQHVVVPARRIGEPQELLTNDPIGLVGAE